MAWQATIAASSYEEAIHFMKKDIGEGESSNNDSQDRIVAITTRKRRPPFAKLRSPNKPEVWLRMR